MVEIMVMDHMFKMFGQKINPKVLETYKNLLEIDEETDYE